MFLHSHSSQFSLFVQPLEEVSDIMPITDKELEQLFLTMSTVLALRIVCLIANISVKPMATVITLEMLASVVNVRQFQSESNEFIFFSSYCYTHIKHHINNYYASSYIGNVLCPL